MVEVHKYFCVHCHLYVFGDDAVRLALILNAHNDHMHPTEFAGWTGLSILSSQQYSGSSYAPPYLADYVSPVSEKWGTAKPPNITERDKIFLERNGVKWD